jgi:hypothetical protein
VVLPGKNKNRLPLLPVSPLVKAAQSGLLPLSMSSVVLDYISGKTTVPVHVPAPVETSKAIVAIVEQPVKSRLAVSKDLVLESQLKALNTQLKADKTMHITRVVTEWGIRNSFKVPGVNYEFECRAFDQFRMYLETLGIPFDHSLVRVDPTGSCYSYAALAPMLLSQYYSKRDNHMTARELKLLVAREMLENPFKVYTNLQNGITMTYIDCFIQHEDETYFLAYEQKYTELSELSQREVMADYRQMCFNYTLVKEFNNELISVVTADILGLTMHQFGEELCTWCVYNGQQEEVKLHNVFLMNNGIHYWTWIHNSEIRNQKVVASYSELELEMFARTHLLLNFRTLKCLEPLSKADYMPAKRPKGRQIERLAKLNKIANEEAIVFRNGRKRVYKFYLLGFVLSNVKSLLPAEDYYRDLSPIQALLVVLERSEGWVDGQSDRKWGVGVLTAKVFSESICLQVLAYLVG